MRSSLVVSSSILRASLRVLLASVCDVCVRVRERKREGGRKRERKANESTEKQRECLRGGCIFGKGAC